MSTIIFTRGLPGSGKSTEAKEWVSADPSRRARVNRDDIRAMIHDDYHGWETEKKVTLLAHAAVKAFIKSGLDVIIDDTNLQAKHLREWLKFAKVNGADVEFWDQFLDVPLDVCQARNMGRDRVVPPKVIAEMHEKFLRNGPPPIPEIKDAEVLNGELYVGDPHKPEAIIVDIDGTIARNTGGRGYYDWDRVGEDTPVEEIIRIVKLFAAEGFNVIVTTGRDASCRYQTEFWLDAHDVPWDELYMRPERDIRKDNIVKAELFDRFKNEYNVRYVLDDRNQVVEQWRALGLTVLQVSDGDF